MKLFLFFVLSLLAVGMIMPSYAIDSSLDKSSYYSGDIITLSGSVNYDPMEAPFVIVQIINPAASDFVQVDTFAPNPDGTFTKTYAAEGPKWNLNGIYTLKIFYGEDSQEIPFDYVIETTEPVPEEIPQPEESTEPEETLEQEETTQPEDVINPTPEIISIPTTQTLNEQPKTHIPGFPALDKSPQYYIDRYNDEANYKSWFDSQFSGKAIADVVGYEASHIPDFPALDKSPQYYIDRYNDEPNYKSWFDSQFPGKSIYNVLGFPNPVAVPDWIKSNAEWWSTGEITDETFISGLEFMIEENIIVIPNIPTSSENSQEDVPNWVRNNASWWALGKISEEEFVNGIKYLIEKGIIVV